jgi:hypothetical protein
MAAVFINKRVKNMRGGYPKELYNTRIYQCWYNMKTRCLNPKNKRFKDWGGRGIKVCDKWLTFKGFYEDMHNGYSDKLTLDRIDNGGNYEKGNCRWVDRLTQAQNTKEAINLTYKGVTKVISAWARDLGINHQTICQRIKVYGWSVDRALSTQPQRRIYG